MLPSPVSLLLFLFDCYLFDITYSIFLIPLTLSGICAFPSGGRAAFQTTPACGRGSIPFLFSIKISLTTELFPAIPDNIHFNFKAKCSMLPSPVSLLLFLFDVTYSIFLIPLTLSGICGFPSGGRAAFQTTSACGRGSIPFLFSTNILLLKELDLVFRQWSSIKL